MSRHALFALLLLALPSATADAAERNGVALAQLTIHQRIVIRIPRITRERPDRRSQPPELRWVEKKGLKCVAMATLEGALISANDSVDLMIEDGTRLRAHFDDKCPAIDFYSGLYIKGTPDGMVCARRDSIRARSGSSCRIDRLRRLALKQK